MFIFTQGLFKFDFTDHHAILGVSLDAKFPEIRKRYMRVARRLHPDTCPFENETDQEFANQLLSKLVSPAYNKFSKESDRAELFAILNKLSNTVTQQRSQIEFTTDAAKQIAKGGNYQEIYIAALQELSDRQYESLDKTLEITGEISELNLAYLLRKQALGGGTVVPPPPPPRPPVKPPVGRQKSTTPKPKAQNSLVEQACSRAETLISNKSYAKAILELKGALKTDPNHSRCHALLGLCYLQQNQGTMAKIEVKKALSLNPQEPKALEVKRLLEQAVSTKTIRKAVGKTENKGNKTDKGGGLFGGFFGGNKK